MNTQATNRNSNSNSNTITIQKTSKECKAAMLVGGAVSLVGLALIFLGGVSCLASGAFLVIAGTTVHISAKTVAWWNHG